MPNEVGPASGEKRALTERHSTELRAGGRPFSVTQQLEGCVPAWGSRAHSLSD